MDDVIRLHNIVSWSHTFLMDDIKETIARKTVEDHDPEDDVEQNAPSKKDLMYN
jgi:hypothetical protein